MVCIENKDSIRGRIQEGVQSLLFIRDLPVETGIIDRDRGLVCEGLQQYAIVGSKKFCVITEDKDDADHLSMGSQGQGCTIEEPHAGCVGEFLQHTVEFIDVQLTDVFFGEQWSEIAQESGCNPMSCCDMPAILF